MSLELVTAEMENTPEHGAVRTWLVKTRGGYVRVVWREVKRTCAAYRSDESGDDSGTDEIASVRNAREPFKAFRDVMERVELAACLDGLAEFFEFVRTLNWNVVENARRRERSRIDAENKAHLEAIARNERDYARSWSLWS